MSTDTSPRRGTPWPANPLAAARQALTDANQLGNLDPDDRIRYAAAGANVGQMQLAHVQFASAFALVSIAETLQAILEDERSRR